MKSLRLLLSADLSPAQKARIAKRIRWSLADLFDECQLSPRVRRYLYGRSGVFGENESTVSAAMYASGTAFYHRHASFPRDGFLALLEGLASIILREGGAVDKGKQVTVLHRERNRIVEARCADGTRYPCDLVISNLSPRQTGALLPRPEFPSRRTIRWN